eukprot:7226189-Alexandrium_andersonii.AAC.1
MYVRPGPHKCLSKFRNAEGPPEPCEGERTWSQQGMRRACQAARWIDRSCSAPSLAARSTDVGHPSATARPAASTQ